MEARAFGDHWVIRLDKGEEILETLKGFAADKGIRLGTIRGIGAVNKATIGVFLTGSKEYLRREVAGDHEITSLEGNISRMDGEVYLHVHANLADVRNNTIGGHLNAAVVSATCEVVVQILDGEMEREFNEEVGLNLYKF